MRVNLSDEFFVGVRALHFHSVAICFPCPLGLGLWFKLRTAWAAAVSLNLPTFSLFLSMASENARRRCSLGSKEPA